MNSLDAADLFVLLERAFRRRSRECNGCAFSLPFKLPDQSGRSWGVVASHTCSPSCKLILDDLVDELQGSYRLAG